MAMSVRVTTLNGRIVHEIRHGVESFFLRDQQGSTIALAGVDGKITDTYQYWPFGEVLSHVGGSATPFTFLGTLGYFSDFLAMYYVRARHLRADLARWLTVDPLWPMEPAFIYAGDEPVLLVDQFGLRPSCLCPGSRPSIKRSDPRYNCAAKACRRLAGLCDGTPNPCTGPIACSQYNAIGTNCAPSNPYYSECFTRGGNGNGQAAGSYCCVQCLINFCCNIEAREEQDRMRVIDQAMKK